MNSAVNYGGRVTDKDDIRLIDTIQKRFVCPEIMGVNSTYSPSGIYKTLEPGS